MALIKYTDTRYILILLSFVTALIYFQGITGPFVLDDNTSILPLQAVPHNNIDYFVDYIFSGTTGPTGRPVALFTFVINSLSNSVDPYWFKVVNILLHIICGLLVYKLIYILSKLSNNTLLRKNSNYISVFTTLVWMLHPIHVSTVLYSVQRMTQLSAIFSLLALITFLKRYSLDSSPPSSNRFIDSRLVLFCIFALLAIFSKENAVLIFPSLTLIYFIFIKKIKSSREIDYPTVILAVIPTILLLGYLLLKLENYSIASELRGFSTTERLLTQSRVLVLYAKQIIYPDINSLTLHYDNFAISSNLFTPIKTLVSLLFLLITIVFIFLSKNRVIQFAISWFLIWHILEGTVVPLEMYYEHRNYLPSIGIILTINYLSLLIYKQIPIKLKNLTLLIPIAYVLSLIISLYSLVNIWSNDETLYIHWYKNNPTSLRATIILADHLVKTSRFSGAKKLITESIKTYPKFNANIPINMRALLYECASNHPINVNLEKLFRLLNEQYVRDRFTIFEYQNLINNIISGNCKVKNLDVIHELLELIELKSLYNHRTNQHELLYIDRARLYLHERKIDKVIEFSEKSFKIKPSKEIALLMTSLYKKLNDSEKQKKWFNKLQKLNSQRKWYEYN